ncbi:MAG: hypothetical protein U0559_12440 [Anaerolineae bacterium]
MVKHVKNPRFWLGAIVLVWLSLIFTTPTSQPAIAQPKVTELNPPFKFVEADRQPLVAVRPPGSTVIMTETFGVGFNPVTAVTGTVPLWRKVVNPTDTAGYYWGRVGSGAFVNTAWSAVAQATPGLPLLTPGSDPYPDGQDTWLLYGPIDLSKYFYATLDFEYYLDATSNDELMWGVTTDGSTVVGYNSLGGNGGAGWKSGTLQFDRALWGNSTAYIVFGFKSGANPSGLGPFIRNVSLRGESIYFVYAPLVVKDYPPTPTPTPTATPIPSLYSYTFDQANTSDLAAWGGAYYSGGSPKYGQCIPGQCSMHYTSAHGNPANSLRLYTTGVYHMMASSPNNITPDNFDLYMDISPWVIYPRSAGCPFGCPDNDIGDWYGIIFNASNDTFGANPSQFAYNKTYYRLYFYNVDSVKPINIQLDRCDGGSSSGTNTCNKLGASSLPANFIGNASGFDTVHIQRQASGPIQVWLNDTLLISVSDTTYTGSGHGKFGAFIFSWTLNAQQEPPTGYEMQIDFDNIKVYQR